MMRRNVFQLALNEEVTVWSSHPVSIQERVVKDQSAACADTNGPLAPVHRSAIGISNVFWEANTASLTGSGSIGSHATHTLG